MRIAWILIIFIFLEIGIIYAHEGEEHVMEGQKTQSGENLGICPVMHEAASKEYTYTFEGQSYYFCCLMCAEKFRNNPQKYIAKIKQINLESFQFGFSPDSIVVKKDDIVKLVITSRDVPHGVYIKEYGINVDIKKGEVKKIEFIADKVGEFDILCSIYCGRGHSQMKGKFIVEE